MSISLIKSADKTTVSNTDVINFIIDTKNTNTDSIQNVEIADILPSCLILVPNSVTLNFTAVADTLLTTGIIIPVLQPNSTATVRFQATVQENCIDCIIENTATVKYLLGGQLYSQPSNTLSITKKGCNCSFSITDSNYVIPGQGGISEIVMMSDQKFSNGILTLPGNTLAMSGEALNLLYQAFFLQYPATIATLNPTNDYNISSLLVALNDSGIISFSKTHPTKSTILNYNVAVNEIINNPTLSNSMAILDPIAAQYPGKVFYVQIGRVYIYLYLSFEALSDIQCGVASPNGYNAIATKGSLGVTIYPQPAKASLGASCGSCGVCGVCGGCALCGPSAVLGAAAAAAVSVISVSSSVAAFSTFMSNN